MKLVAPVVVALVIALGAGRAEARTKFIDTDDEILKLGSIPDELREAAVDDDGRQYDQVGFHYKRIAIVGADVWSWSGHVVFYQAPKTTFEGYRTVETTWYIDVPDELADQYGWKTPIEYRVPVGLLVALCLVEFAIIASRKRPAKIVLGLGIGLVLLSVILFLLGMTWQIAFPLLLGLFHIVTALPIFHPATNAEAAAIDDEPEVPLAPKRPSERVLPPPPNVETDPFRAPPQPPPIVVQRASSQSVAAPIVKDDSADGPKLLR